VQTKKEERFFNFFFNFVQLNLAENYFSFFFFAAKLTFVILEFLLSSLIYISISILFIPMNVTDITK